MPHSVWAGLGLTLLADLGSGNCMFPMKFARRWKWENLWLIFSLVSLVAIPWILALGLVGKLWSVYSATSIGAMVLAFLLGAGWGIAQILFGLSVARLGLALGYPALQKRHIEDYWNLFDRVSLTLGSDAAAKPTDLRLASFAVAPDPSLPWELVPAKSAALALDRSGVRGRGEPICEIHRQFKLLIISMLY